MLLCRARIQEGKIETEVVDAFEEQSTQPIIRLNEHQGLLYQHEQMILIGK